MRVRLKGPPGNPDGIGSIFHTYAFFIDKRSRYVSPVPDSRLDAFRVFTLGKALSASDYANAVRYLQTTSRQIGRFFEQYDVLLEEQAFPFEEQAISIHEINVRRSWDGVYDQWVQKSFAALRALVPARFDKQEMQVGYVDTIR